AALHEEHEGATDGAGAGAATQAAASGAVTATRTAAGKPVSRMRTGSLTPQYEGRSPKPHPGRDFLCRRAEENIGCYHHHRQRALRLHTADDAEKAFHKC